MRSKNLISIFISVGCNFLFDSTWESVVVVSYYQHKNNGSFLIIQIDKIAYD